MGLQIFSQFFYSFNFYLLMVTLIKSGNSVKMFFNDYHVEDTQEEDEFHFEEPSGTVVDGLSACLIRVSTDLSVEDPNVELSDDEDLAADNESGEGSGEGSGDGTPSLTNSIANRLPCILPRDVSINDMQGFRCWAAGWGKDANGLFAKHLQSVGVNFMTRNYCLKHSHYSEEGSLESDQFCAGAKPEDTNGESALGGRLTSEGGAGCDGDDGGPLVCDVYGVATLVGIQDGFSEENCGKEGYPTKYRALSPLKILTRKSIIILFI